MTHNHQTETPWSASLLRRDLNARAQQIATINGLLHEQTTGSEPSILFGHEEQAEQIRHGNFHPASYAAICDKPEWSRRLKKAHTAHRRVRARADWHWMELDCANSSDALLMNIFCHPLVFSDGHLSTTVAALLGVPTNVHPNFGIHPGVPLKKVRSNNRKKTTLSITQPDTAPLFNEAALPKPSLLDEPTLKDRTEIDLQLGSLFIEAKLTESNFQTASPRLIERYRDLETIFDIERLPRKIITPAATHPATEDFSDLEEPAINSTIATSTAKNSRTIIQGYQLIRNVLAAFAYDASFCVLCDARRHDLIETWYAILSAVHYPSFAWRLKLLTWQELDAVLPEYLQTFLETKYGIIPA